MNIIHVLLETAHGPLSFSDLASGGRGVTGSEQSMLYLAQTQAALGHRVAVYMPTDGPQFANGVEVLDVRKAWPRLRKLDRADVVISWLSADPLRVAPATALKVHSIQINDWLLNAPDFDSFVDVYVCVSEAHREHLWNATGHPEGVEKVEILPNGVDLSRFREGNRIPHRCVYLSSPDRGLHWLLAMWMEIRFAYPKVTLDVYYEVQKWLDSATFLNSDVGMRAKFIVEKSRQLAPHGVRFHGAVSPDDVAKALSTADLMLYPCDPVRFTEGFGVAVLEACAAGVVPVLTDADAFGEVYKYSGAVVIPRKDGGAWLDKFLDRTLHLLGDRSEVEERRPEVKAFAAGFGWQEVTRQWELMIEKRRASRG